MALTNAERQAAWRKRRDELAKQAELRNAEQAELRNDEGRPADNDRGVLRNDTATPTDSDERVRELERQVEGLKEQIEELKEEIEERAQEIAREAEDRDENWANEAWGLSEELESVRDGIDSRAELLTLLHTRGWWNGENGEGGWRFFGGTNEGDKVELRFEHNNGLDEVAIRTWRSGQVELHIWSAFSDALQWVKSNTTTYVT